MNQKGQMMSFDIMAAGFIFLLIIGAAFTTYSAQKTTMADELSLQEMHFSAINALNSMLSDQNCYSGGLVNKKGALSLQGLSCVNSLDYNSLKSTLSIDAYDFTIQISDLNSTYLQKGFTATKRAVSVQRAGVLESTPVKINFILYEK
jgi:hypothetical protein